jgi:hypothetical protein
MEDEIVNRVAQSKLVTFDLEDYYPEGKRALIDIKDWLYEEFILKEKDFRSAVAAHDWEQYRDAYVALHCSTEAIVPAWAYMLITTYLKPYAKRVVLGDLQALETAIYADILEEIELEEYRDKPVIIKGCSHKPVPPNAYVQATAALLNVARSVFYGEACSSVPLYKRK